jgi:hypothetical protein
MLVHRGEMLLRKPGNVLNQITTSMWIHVQIEPDIDLREFKQIASAIIYFEAAIEALVSQSRRRCPDLKSPHRDGPVGTGSPRNRAGRFISIARIDNAVDDVDVYELMQDNEDVNYAWQFNGLMNHGTRNLIAFCKAPNCVTPEETLSWTELAITFLQAARLQGTLQTFNRLPANIGGLARFLKLCRSEGVSRPEL